MPDGRDTDFATFASAWCAGYIAHREGLRDTDREAFAARLMADYERWCGPLRPPPLVAENMVVSVAGAIHDAYRPDEGDDLEVAWVNAVRVALHRTLWGQATPVYEQVKPGTPGAHRYRTSDR